jgi:hypothetical protein
MYGNSTLYSTGVQIMKSGSIEKSAGGDPLFKRRHRRDLDFRLFVYWPT